MNENQLESGKKKYLTTAGISCLPMFLMFLSFAVISVILSVGALQNPGFNIGANMPALIFSVLILFVGAKILLFIGSIVFAITFLALAASYLWMGVSLIRQSDEEKGFRTLKRPFVLTLIICLLSIYPSIIGFGRLIAHGFDSSLYQYLILGLLPLILTSICLILNRRAVKKLKTSSFEE